MRSRPFSLGAYLLRVLWDGVPVLLWLAYAVWLYRFLGHFLQIQPELLVPFILFGLWSTMYALRPVRKFLMLNAYRLMLYVPLQVVAELSIWKLLLVNDRYWPSDLPDYIGTAIFGRVYGLLPPSGAQRLNRILWRVEFLGKPHLSKPARAFLREVNAPLQEDAEPVGPPRP